MRISVIIPAYNEEKTLGRSLRAVLDQDHPDFEVIVVDNASSDGTSLAAAAFPVKVVYEPRKGTMWACERGRREARGDLIVRMDADCLPEKDWLRRGEGYFSDDRVVVVSGPYDFHDAPPAFRRSSLFIQRRLFAPINRAMQLFRLRRGITMGGNTFLRASALERVGGFNTDIAFYGDDTELPKRMSKIGKIVFHPDFISKTSARRYKNEGIVKLQARYLFHFFKQVFSR